nr:hypothetical protein [Propionicimonas sp.]
MKSRREQLRPEVRARTILAGCAYARLTALGDAAEELADADQVGLVVDRSGAAYLVLAHGAQTPEGRIRISCRASLPGLGVLRLEGRCGDALRLVEQPDIAELLTLHRTGWAATDESDELVVISLDLDAVTVLTPATDERRAGVVPVALDQYFSAGPDAWLLYGESAREQLERAHQEHLVALVQGAPDGPAFEPIVVSVRSISPEQLELACLCLDGVTPVTVPIDQPLEHPGDLCHWVTQAARRVA